MGEPAVCPTCGRAIPADAPGGACPRCLLVAALPAAGPSAAAAAPQPAAPPSADEVEAKLQGFEILSVVGHGGMGVVYKARQKALDRVVALKVLPPSVAAAPGFAERFAREAKALARLTHPNIVAVHDFGETDGLCWLVMEYVDGLNVREAMRAGRVGPREALAIVPQICDALQYAHDRGVVHRDVKPENVLIDRDGRVKVADFGLAKLVGRETGDVSLTGAQQVMGTLHYMAPEQWKTPKEVDHRADIYSLGVVFYEMLTGELPLGRFEAPSMKAAIDARIDEVVLRSLERERDRRWQHVSEVRTKVEEIAAAPGPAAPPPPPAPAVVPVPASGDADERGLQPGEDEVTSNVVGAVVLFAITIAAGVAAIVAGQEWAWWVAGSTFVGAAACVATAVTEQRKRRAALLPAGPPAPPAPREPWITPRAIGLAGAATVAILVTAFSAGLGPGAGGIQFGAVAAALGGVLTILVAARWAQSEWGDPATRGPPGPPVLIEVVSAGTVVVGLLYLAAATFGTRGTLLPDHAGGISGTVEGPRDPAPPAAPPSAPPGAEVATAPWDFPVHTGGLAMEPTSEQRRELWRRWSALQAVHGRLPFTALMEMYAEDDWGRLTKLTDQGRDVGGDDGSLGLPLLDPEELGGSPLTKFRIEKVDLADMYSGIFRTAHVVARCGRKVVRFEMVWGRARFGDSDTWCFAAAPVVVE